jgi:thiamine pyrophosphokinase
LTGEKSKDSFAIGHIAVFQTASKNMKNKICYVVGAGENYGLDFALCSSDMLIAADAGLRYIEKSGRSADLMIGDFDTLRYKPEHGNVVELSAEKDDTDMLAAVREGVKAGYEVFHIYCGMGGRVEHTIANVQLLAKLSQSGKQGFLFGKNCVMTIIANKTLTFPKQATGFISVFSYSEKSEGVYLKGLKYELHNATLTSAFPIGVSNEFTGSESKIVVKSGTLLIVYPKEITEVSIQ